MARLSISAARSDLSGEPAVFIPGAHMQTNEETRQVAEAFLTAWTRRDEAAARRLMADDIHYENMLHSYDSADTLLPALLRFAGMLNGAPLVASTVEGDRAALLYDCQLPAPVGILRTAWFMRIANGKVKSIFSAFDATELRKLPLDGGRS
jgi:hypothetical protein